MCHIYLLQQSSLWPQTAETLLTELGLMRRRLLRTHHEQPQVFDRHLIVIWGMWATFLYRLQSSKMWLIPSVTLQCCFIVLWNEILNVSMHYFTSKFSNVWGQVGAASLTHLQSAHHQTYSNTSTYALTLSILPQNTISALNLKIMHRCNFLTFCIY